MVKFDIQQKPYGFKLFEKPNVEVNPGVTVLVGCNGFGKTTMLRQIKDQLEDGGFPFMKFDNKADGGSRAMDEFLLHSKMAELATMATSSEGEQIMVVLGDYAMKMGQLVRNNRDKDIFILIDAVDSGFSIDNIDEVKDSLFKLIIEDHQKDVYIICTANSYEMARGEDCIDAMSCEHVRFADYEEYREFILEASKRKGERDK